MRPVDILPSGESNPVPIAYKADLFQEQVWMIRNMILLATIQRIEPRFFGRSARGPIALPTEQSRLCAL